MNNENYAKERAIAIKQYRFLMKVANKAKSNRYYYYYSKYYNEAAQLKLQYNL